MENKNQLESGYKINNLVLLESNFKREANVTFNNPEIENEVDINVDVNVNGDVILVTESLNYSQTFNQIKEVSATIKMIGVFEKFGNSELDKESFGQINGAAIIFPYIREHLSNLSVKAGINMILLPPANFVKK